MTILQAPPATWRPSYRGLLALADALGVDLEPFQRRCLRACFEPERETAIVLPRGSGKSTIGALLALHVLITHPRGTVAVGSTSRGQAAIVRTMLEDWAEHPALDGRLQLLAVQGDRAAARWDGGGSLSVISGKGSRAVGRTDDLMLVDEAWALAPAKRQGDDLIGALQTSMAKARDGRQPRGRLVVISTAAPNLDGPLGRMRARALAGHVTRRGGHLTAVVPGILRWLEWSVPDGTPAADLAATLRANPASWQTRDVLAEAQQRCSPLDFAQHHQNAWGIGDATWLPAGAWHACRADYAIEHDEPLYLGVDIGGTRSASALIAVTADLRIAHIAIRQGERAVLAITDEIAQLARTRRIREVAYDPMRFADAALRLERDNHLTMVTFDQHQTRMTAASEGLHAAIVEGRLRHPGDPQLNRHAATAVAKATPRGWRLDKANETDQIDALIALAMAVSRATAAGRARPTRYLGMV